MPSAGPGRFGRPGALPAAARRPAQARAIALPSTTAIVAKCSAPKGVKSWAIITGYLRRGARQVKGELQGHQALLVIVILIVIVIGLFGSVAGEAGSITITITITSQGSNSNHLLLIGGAQDFILQTCGIFFCSTILSGLRDGQRRRVAEEWRQRNGRREEV